MDGSRALSWLRHQIEKGVETVGVGERGGERKELETAWRRELKRDASEGGISYADCG